MTQAILPQFLLHLSLILYEHHRILQKLTLDSTSEFSVQAHFSTQTKEFVFCAIPIISVQRAFSSSIMGKTCNLWTKQQNNAINAVIWIEFSKQN